MKLKKAKFLTRDKSEKPCFITVVLRGGNYWGTNVWNTSPAGYRWDDNSANANNNKGFRATLILLLMFKFKDLFQQGIRY